MTSVRKRSRLKAVRNEDSWIRHTLIYGPIFAAFWIISKGSGVRRDLSDGIFLTMILISTFWSTVRRHWHNRKVRRLCALLLVAHVGMLVLLDTYGRLSLDRGNRFFIMMTLLGEVFVFCSAIDSVTEEGAG